MKYVADKQCPQCGEKMKYGILNCKGYPIDWIPIEADYAEDRWKCDLSGYVRLNGLTMTLRGAAERNPTAYHCAKCKKIIVDY